MKRQSFERAVEINARLDYLEDLISLLMNATNDYHNLAAVRVPDTYNPENVITNEMKLDTDIMSKFIKILRDEQKELREEFDKL